MASYFVQWVCGIEADSPEDACLQAHAMLLDPQSTATVFYADHKGKRTVIDVEGGTHVIIRDER